MSAGAEGARDRARTNMLAGLALVEAAARADDDAAIVLVTGNDTAEAASLALSVANIAAHLLAELNVDPSGQRSAEQVLADIRGTALTNAFPIPPEH